MVLVLTTIKQGATKKGGQSLVGNAIFFLSVVDVNLF